MCSISDDIFDGGLSDIRGDREYQRSRGFNAPLDSVIIRRDTQFTLEEARIVGRQRRARRLLSSPQGETTKVE